MATRTQPADYYTIRDRVLVLMADQAGQPFDASNYRHQFRIAAREQGFRPGEDGYLPRFTTVQKWVRAKLPHQSKSAAPLARSPAPAPVPRAWRDPQAFDVRRAQLPPGDRD